MSMEPFDMPKLKRLSLEAVSVLLRYLRAPALASLSVTLRAEEDDPTDLETALCSATHVSEVHAHSLSSGTRTTKPVVSVSRLLQDNIILPRLRHFTIACHNIDAWQPFIQAVFHCGPALTHVEIHLEPLSLLDYAWLGNVSSPQLEALWLPTRGTRSRNEPALAHAKVIADICAAALRPSLRAFQTGPQSVPLHPQTGDPVSLWDDEFVDLLLHELPQSPVAAYLRAGNSLVVGDSELTLNGLDDYEKPVLTCSSCRPEDDPWPPQD